MLILGIETSADDTAVALVEINTRRMVAQAIYTQATEHAKYGGIVPEIASRAHQAHLKGLIEKVLTESGVALAKVDAIAATTGPGLTTALAIGAAFGKTLALALGKPFLATNHIEGHALSALLAEGAAGAALAEAFFTHQQPYLLLLVTGGHTQLILVKAVGDYQLLGTTADDAVGECFDKTGALLGLPHPAGPKIETLAMGGNPTAISFPHPRTKGALDFSFSGLKTAVRQAVESQAHQPADIAASLQHTAAALLAEKLTAALQQTGAKHAVVAGGVAANQTIRAALQAVCAAHGVSFTAPPLYLCTDNAAMIAYAAGLRVQAGLPNGAGGFAGGLAAPLHPRWAL